MAHSKARLEGICDYRLWTTEELIEAYAFEAKRYNRKDGETAQPRQQARGRAFCSYTAMLCLKPWEPGKLRPLTGCKG